MAAHVEEGPWRGRRGSVAAASVRDERGERVEQAVEVAVGPLPEVLAAAQFDPQVLDRGRRALRDLQEPLEERVSIEPIAEFHPPSRVIDVGGLGLLEPFRIRLGDQRGASDVRGGFTQKSRSRSRGEVRVFGVEAVEVLAHRLAVLDNDGVFVEILVEDVTRIGQQVGNGRKPAQSGRRPDAAEASAGHVQSRLETPD